MANMASSLPNESHSSTRHTDHRKEEFYIVLTLLSLSNNTNAIEEIQPAVFSNEKKARAYMNEHAKEVYQNHFNLIKPGVDFDTFRMDNTYHDIFFDKIEEDEIQMGSDATEDIHSKAPWALIVLRTSILNV